MGILGSGLRDGLSLHPIRYPWAYDLYNQAVANTWFPNEVQLVQDLADFEKYEGKTDISNFKYIKKVKDDFPVLTKEMILLSKVMSEELFCTRIQAIETIIPTIFKNKYIEYYELLDPNTTLLIDYAKYFNNNKLIEKKKFEKIFTKEQIGQLISLKAIKLISKNKEIKTDTETYII